MILWLFDIDGTLLRSDSAGRQAMDRSFHALYGVSGAFDEVDFRGALDDGVLARAFEAWSIPGGRAERDRFVAHFAGELRRGMCPARNAEQRLCPGVPAVLDALEPRGPLALVTGNWKVGARAKLGAFDLWGRFPFGGFSDDGSTRAALIRVATRCARERGLTPHRVVMIGDTPNDVNAAREAGAVAVAVQTGWTEPEALSASGPDLLLPDLERGLDALLAL